MFESLNRHTLTLATTFMLSKSFSIPFPKKQNDQAKSCCHALEAKVASAEAMAAAAEAKLGTRMDFGGCF